MPNIPGISGYTQPGVFARDRVVSTGVSIPGGIRVPCIMGEGLREELLVAAAVGAGLDGSSAISPTGNGDGRFFQLSLAPVFSGRTELYLNGSILFGTEDSTRTDGTWDSDGFSGTFDYRLDPTTGAIELQAAAVADQDGAMYAPSSTNTGDATLYDGDPGGWDLISVVDNNALGEIWTVRCVSVTRDSNGDPIPGMATFTASGSASGMLRNSSGQPYLWDSNAYTSDHGALSGSSDVGADGFQVAFGDTSGTSFDQGNPVDRSGAGDELTDQFIIHPANLPTQGQALVGDYFIAAGEDPIEITDISYDGTDTTITLATASLPVNGEALTDWEIRAINLLIDDPNIAHHPTTGAITHPDTEGPFTSAHVGKVVLVTDNDAAGLYYIMNVTSSRRVRLASFDDTSVGLPFLSEGATDGLISGDDNTTFYILQTNGVLLFGIRFGSIAAEVGDKFYIDINSKVLDQGDSLEARYIYELDVEDPELFASAKQLFAKHGVPSLTNTLSLGAQMAFENGAPALLALQCKPALPRRTSTTILEEQEGGVGGFSGGTEPDDLYFPISRPVSGLRDGRPDTDTQANVFIIRNGEETQVFPNKVGFYNSQYENDVGILNFTTGSDTAYSYTIINTQREIVASGEAGEVSVATSEFSTKEVDFDADDIVNGAVIVVQSLLDAGGTLASTENDVSTALFGDASHTSELTIVSITDDNTVTVAAADDGVTTISAACSNIQFYIYDVGDNSNLSAALMLNEDLVDNGVLQQGDGIRISYIDEKDADFFDVNWFNAFEALESADCQMVVPLPTQNRFGIFRASVNHCENMSTIAIQKERIAFFGAQQGITAEALVGYEELAVEDIGVLEGIQGDDAEEVLDGNIEDMVNLKLNDNYTSNRAVYFFPDRIVRNVAGTNTYIDGFYMAAAAVGWLGGMQNVAVPLTYKTLSGFSIIRDRKYNKTMENLIGNVGATLVTPVTGGGKILHARTTSISGFVEDEEVSVMFIRDRVKHVLRESLKGFLGTVENPNTQGLITARVINLMAGLVSQGLVTAFANTRVERDKVDPRQWNVFTRFQPAYPINYIFIDIEVGVT